MLFKNDEQDLASCPLAEQLRPKSLSEVIGQDHLLAKGAILQNMIESANLRSMIFWGPAGSGKTTIARLLSKELNDKYLYESLSAIFTGISDLKKLFDKAKINKSNGYKTIIFIDEIHRFNKAQQDCLLPVIEDGTITFIGATTENPSYSLNNALLSRLQLLKFYPHKDIDLYKLLTRAEVFLGKKLPLDEEGKRYCIKFSQGDCRKLLGIVDILSSHNLTEKQHFNLNDLSEILQTSLPNYDKNSDMHYNLISALHKSIRGSDPQAALYYLTRMINAGEDILYLCRRLARIATEDIGLADPQALLIVNAAKDHYEFVGSPEGELAIAQACLYLATSPKSTAVYDAYKTAMEDAKETGSLLPPPILMPASNKFLKDQGYGVNYIYDPDVEHSFSGQNYFPQELARQNYYQPKERGFEREIKKRLQWWDKLRNLIVMKNVKK